MPSSHLILCHPLLLPPIPLSIRVFSNESTLPMRWPKYWSFSFSIIPSKEIPGLISFRMDWLDLLAVQETLKSLLQHHSSKASILQCSVFFIVQLSHPYMTTGKTIVLTRTMVNIFGFLGHIQLCDCSMKEAMHHKSIGGCGRVPVHLYLEKAEAGRICPKAGVCQLLGYSHRCRLPHRLPVLVLELSGHMVLTASLFF